MGPGPAYPAVRPPGLPAPGLRRRSAARLFAGLVFAGAGACFSPWNRIVAATGTQTSCRDGGRGAMAADSAARFAFGCVDIRPAVSKWRYPEIRSRREPGRSCRGGVPEWLKGTGCKPVGLAYVGSNPTPSTSAIRAAMRRNAGCGCSSMVEPQPSKLVMRVRFPSPAPIRDPSDRTSSIQAFAARRSAARELKLPFPSSRCAARRRDPQTRGNRRPCRKRSLSVRSRM